LSIKQAMPVPASIHTTTVLDTIADALSQPLFAISANADSIPRLAGRQPPDLPEIRAALAEMVRETHRIYRLLADAQRELESRERHPVAGS
jgi:hypothetical protein